MKYYFHPDALQEYSEDAQYYSGISSSLASAFISQIENGIKQILLYIPKLGNLLKQTCAGALSNAFLLVSIIPLKMTILL